MCVTTMRVNGILKIDLGLPQVKMPKWIDDLLSG